MAEDFTEPDVAAMGKSNLIVQIALQARGVGYLLFSIDNQFGQASPHTKEP